MGLQLSVIAWRANDRRFFHRQGPARLPNCACLLLRSCTVQIGLIWSSVCLSRVVGDSAIKDNHFKHFLLPSFSLWQSKHRSTVQNVTCMIYYWLTCSCLQYCSLYGTQQPINDTQFRKEYMHLKMFIYFSGILPLL